MRRGRDEVTFGLNEITCVNCNSPMVWSDEIRAWECQCGTIAFQDETCGKDEIYYEPVEDEIAP